MPYIKKSERLKSRASTHLQEAREADLQHMSMKELKSYIANEGKRLNQQIVEIEKRGLEKESFAYEKLTSKPQYRDYLGTSKSGHLKVNLSTRGMSRPELQRMANVIQKFSQAQTMTASGIKQYYENVFNGLRDTYPGMSKLTDDQLADILKTEGFLHAKGVVGSDTVMKLIQKAASPEQMIEFLKASGSLDTHEESIKKYNQIMGTSGDFEPLPLDFNIFDDDIKK
jgi:hypothetical protein